ncbi:hypothetical protein OEB99_01330 [Actinotalea sp. M2MS4P-6]|uniref:hypothetical protein n=1 Tax=Actinotalea sp. M2MS4P-6 TaxID=2983762 RepID=UPI0021E3E63F|nr:hypothetical protein [Actinotalea sp. M2MS4P-6]MCV2392938.1 hypothetical protein [Actinotalea sp. M2MS4P-6]
MTSSDPGSPQPASPEQRAREDAAIADFWAWWTSTGRVWAARLFDGDGDPDELNALADDLTARVTAIADLAFETGQGRVARHMLVVTAAGDPDLRDVAARWLAAAPAPDDAFEYATGRQPVPDAEHLVIELGEWPVALGEAAVALTEEAGKVHVVVSHPRFSQMPDDARGQVAFLVLDALLGEEAVEDYIGGVSWSPVRAPDAVALTDLVAVVDRLRARS